MEAPPAASRRRSRNYVLTDAAGNGRNDLLTRYLVAYVVTLIVFTAIDFVWLGWIARPFYQSGIGHLMGDQINVPAGLIFYAVYAVGLVVFGVARPLDTGSWQQAMLLGGLFGFFAYGVYDLTNLATLRDWPVNIAVVDMAWGSVLSAIAATAGFLAARQLG